MSRPGDHLSLVLAAVIACMGLSAPLHARMVPTPLPLQAAPAPSPNPPSSEPIHVFITPPLSLDDLWKRLDRPDFVLLRGDDYQGLLRRKDDAREASDRPPSASAAEVTGVVGAESASISIKLRYECPTPGRHRVTAPLGGIAAVVSVREAGRDLPFSLGTDGVGTIELNGAGRHEVVLDCVARVAKSGEECRLNVPIPVCPSTSADFDFAGGVRSISFGDDDPAEARPSPGGTGSTVSARLTPRDRITLVWRAEAPGNARLPAAINADGHMALDVGTDAITIRSNWRITAARGAADVVSIELDPSDELREVELDGRPIANRIAREESGARVRITPPEPLRPGKSLRLTLTARRRLKPNETNRLNFRGFRFENAQLQTGTLAISRSRPVFIEGVVGRSIRRIDPRTELPTDAASRTGTLLAYQFQDQPFELGLTVEPAPPRVRPEPRTTVVVASDQVMLDSWIEYRTTKGQVYDLAVEIGPGVEIDSFGPPDLIESAEYARAGADPRPNGDRRLLLHLSARARELGDFRIHLVGRHPISNKSKPAIELFRPSGENSLGGMLALVGSPGIDVLPARPEAERGGPVNRLDLAAPPEDWVWPKSLENGPDTAVTWLRHTGETERIPIEIVGRTRLLTHDDSIRVDVQRRYIDIEQDLQIAIPYGTIRKLDVLVPPEIQRWSIDSPNVRSNDVLGVENDGTKRHRLSLEADVEKSARFQLRYRIPIRDRQEVASVPLTWIRPIDSAATAESIRVSALPSVDVGVEAKGWDTTRLGLKAGPRARDRFRLTREEPDASAPTLRIKADPIVELPELVAERCRLRTSVSSDGSRGTLARFAIETHGSSIDVALPPGAVWVRVQVNDEDVPEMEKREAPDEYRIILPEVARTGYISLSLLYNEPPSRERRPFQPPRLIDGLVQQTYWEVLIPGIDLAIGVPDGWNDENAWVWSTYVFRRLPTLSPAQLESWLTGETLGPRTADASDRGDAHAYLFSRAGTPPPMSLRIHSKALVLGLCTGITALLGVASVWLRLTAALQLAAIATVGFGIALATDPGVAFTLLQASSFGILMTVSASFLQRVVDRRRGGPPPTRERMGSTLTRAPNPSSNPPAPASLGSDDSTAIRLRTTSSDDKVVLTPETVLPFGSTARSGLEPKHE